MTAPAATSPVLPHAIGQGEATRGVDRAGFGGWIMYRAPDFTFAPRWWWAAVAVAVTTFVHVFVAWTSKGPAIAADEIGAVGAARAIAHGGGDWSMYGSGYMPGVGLLLSPAWWFTDDQYLVYHVGLAIGVACAVACIWPLALIARSAGIGSTTGAVTIAAVVMLAPARTVPSNYLLSESLLLLTTALTVVLAIRASARPSASAMAAVGAMSGLAFLAHGRGIAVTLAACVWGLLVAGGHWRLWLSLGAAAATVAGLSFALFTWVADDLYGHNDRVQKTFDDLDAHTLREVLGTLFGLSWYAMAAWSAVAIAGLGVILKRAPRRRAESLVAIAFVPTVILALVQLGKSADTAALQRLDAWIYGRYVDHLLTIAAVVGLAVLMRVRSRLLTVSVMAVATIVAIAFMVVTVPQMPVGGYWSDVHVAGVSYLLSYDNFLNGRAEPWALFSAVSLAFTALVLVAARVRAVVLVLALLWGALSIATDQTRVDPRNDPGRIVPAVAAALQYLPEDEPVGFNITYERGLNPFVFAAHPRQIRVVTVSAASTLYPGMYTAMIDASPAAFGALPIDANATYSFRVWVFPGKTFDELDAKGLLVHPTASAG